MNEILYLVIPCYNEEEVLPETSRRLKEKMSSLIQTGTIHKDSRILMVDDGSKDKTWSMIESLHNEDPLFSGLKLSKNQGHQNALLAGLMTAKDFCDVSISMDADLQDDIEAIDGFLREYHSGADIVYGVRSARKTDTAFKRGTAQAFYKFMKFMGVDVVYNHADYRLMSRRALEGLSEFSEANLFLRGLVPLIGYSSATVEYERHERFAGKSKYPLKKMLNFAFDGITSFSIRPIRFITGIGFLLFAIAVVLLLVFFITYLCGNTVSGWASTIISIWGIGGLQLLAIGIIGEYVGKSYIETKKRPKYIIETVLNDPGNEG